MAVMGERRRIVGGQDREDARLRFGTARVELGDSSFRDRALHDHTVRDLFEWPLGGIGRGAGYLQPALNACNAFADHAIAPTRVSARTSVRFASSILNAL